MHLEHRLGDAELVLARPELVVHEGGGEFVLAVVAGGQADRGLAVLVLRLLEAFQVLHDLQLEGVGAVGERLEVGPAQREHGAGGGRPDGVRPVAALLPERLVAEVVAVGQGADHGLLAVLSRSQPVELPVRDDEDFVDRRSGGDQDLTRGELALDEAPGQLLQHRVVREAPQDRHLAQGLRQDPRLTARPVEAHPAPADGVAQPTVDPVGAARDLDPGERPEQPTGADLLRLRRGLGRRREVARGRGRETLLVPGLRFTARCRNTGVGFGRHREPFAYPYPMKCRLATCNNHGGPIRRVAAITLSSGRNG